MFRATLVTGIVAAALSFTPALAMDMKCDDATMSMMNTKVSGMKDDAMKKTAMTQMHDAQAAMMKKKEKSCLAHMKAAEKAIGTM